MVWLVVKNEWGFWCTDHPEFNSFEEAYEVAKKFHHFNIVQKSLFKQLTKINPTKGA